MFMIESINSKNLDYPLLHPLRSMSEGTGLCKIEKGDGIYIFDQYGKRYIDGISGLWNVPFGHCNSKINEAITEQLNSIAYVNIYQFSNTTTVEFCKNLLSIVPDSFEKVFLACSGSEAVEIAIKLCRKYYTVLGKQNKKEFVTLDLAYHGTTFAAMSASGMDREYSADYAPLVPGFHLFKTPFYNSGNEAEYLANDLQLLDELFDLNSGSLAGIIVEPILGSGGIIPLPEPFIRRLRELCDLYDVLLIFDEVATGFGRTGSFFALDEYKVVPDIVCLSKGINNGYLSLAADLISKKIIDLMGSTNDILEHFSTQNGNPLACAAGTATIGLLKEPGLLESVRTNGELLGRELQFLLEEHPNFRVIRSRGLMIGVDLVKDKKTNKLLSSGELMSVVDDLFRNGLVVYPFFLKGVCTGFSLFPPLIISEDQTRNIIRIVKRTFSRLFI
ncbi:aspartate aminotransferase family protein [Clostridia bacterium]|nr:aspartate aminotransferase family protein [Clostridia bacterium]